MTRPHRADIVTATAGTALLTALAVWTLVPVYGTTQFFIAATVATVTGLSVGLCCVLFRWAPWVTLCVALATYVIGAMLTAMPLSSIEPRTLAGNLWLALSQPFVGWRGVVTLPAPLGTYQGVMVPAYALLSIGSGASVGLALLTRWWWGPVVSAATLVVAIVVGPASTTRHASLPLSITGTVGIIAFLTMLAWFALHNSLASRRLHHTVDTGTTPAGPRRSIGAITATTILVGSIVCAGVIGAALPASTRDVARAGVTPALALSTATSPLDTYRMFFADEALETSLFTVDSSLDSARVRLAVLDTYDGQSFQAGAQSGEFRRLAAGVDLAPHGTPVSSAITITGLTGIWTPLVGTVATVSFGGERAQELVDTFYFIPGGGSAVTVLNDTVEPGDVFHTEGAVFDEESLANANPGDQPYEEQFFPEAMVEWIEDQEVSADGSGLLELIHRLRARGYVSHAIAVPQRTYAWQDALGEHAFASSPAGHSVSRLDMLFAQLNDRAADVGKDAANDLLIAAIGDDEQFAAAAALLAGFLGFESRIVVGARLSDDDPQGWAPPACENGQCTGANMSAWIEVRTETGWVSVDTSPQNTQALSPTVTNLRDPEFASDLDQDTADVSEPTQSDRRRSGAEGTDTPPESSPFELALPARIGLSVLLIALALLLPVAALLTAKSMRSARRRHDDSDASIEGAWDDLVAAAIDGRRAVRTGATRHETAPAIGTRNAAELALLADRATFDATDATSRDADHAWTMVHQDRAELLTDMSWWRALRARLSLRSLFPTTATTNDDDQGRARAAAWTTHNGLADQAQTHTKTRGKTE